MSSLLVHIPESLHKQLEALAKREGITVDQLVTTSVAEKVSALMTEEYLAARASRSSRAKYDAALATVPDVEPDSKDRLSTP